MTLVAPPILRTTVTSVPALPDVVSDSGYVANAAEVTLADYVQLSLQAGFIQRPAIRHPYHDLKGRQQAQKTLQCGQSAFTEDVRHNRPPYPCHTRKTASADVI